MGGLDRALSGPAGPENYPKKPREATETMRLQMQNKAKESLFFLLKVVLGYKKLNKHVHLPMCMFAQTAKYNRRMMLMPRSHYKTTIWTIGQTIWDIVNDPDVQILIIADTEKNASRFLKEIQNHFEFNSMFRWVFSEIVPKNFSSVRWSATEMQVIRKGFSRDPTVDAIGAGGGVESRHYHIIRADDLITQKHKRSDLEMDTVINWVGSLESLLVSPKDRIDIVGSRKKNGDLYSHIEKIWASSGESVEIGPYATFKGELATFSRSAVENGKPIFPEEVPLSFLTRLRRTDPDRYHSEYANSPKGSGLNTFRIEWLRYAQWLPNGEILCQHKGETLYRVHPNRMQRLILFDPSVAEKSGSSQQAIIVVAKGTHPFRFVLESHIGHFPPDEAIDLLFNLDEKWKPDFISVERRGYQGSIKYWLNERAESENRPYLDIIEYPMEGSVKAMWAKPERIRGLQPMIRSNLLWVFEDQLELLQQIEFYPNVRWDDGLDVLAQSLDYWPMMEGEDAQEERKSREIEFLSRTFHVSPAFVEQKEEEEFDENKFLRSIHPGGFSAVFRA